MNMHDLNVGRYLKRIGYDGNAAPTAQTLRDLQFAHLRTVPYENLDIVRGIPLSLEIPALEDKIVSRHRGGYCFELNALYGALLQALGYEVEVYFARFLLGEETIPMRRHQVLAVAIPGSGEVYLSDVGVGVGSPNFPLLLQEGLEQAIGSLHYRFLKDTFLEWVLSFATGDGPYRPLFSFTEEPQLPIDFVATSFYCERSPDSRFNKQDMVALRTETGRYTLDGDTFKHFDGDSVTAWVEETPVKRAETLQRTFGITL